MSFKNCGIVFHGSSQGVLYSGHRVTGAFHIRQLEPKKIQDLTFKITGEARTRWSKSRGSGKNRKSVLFYGRETYFDTVPVTLIRGHQTQDGSAIIEPGLNTFNFSFTLPRGIPSSFEGLYGKIRYNLKVIAKRANKFDKSRKFPFTVICSSDLNLNPENRSRGPNKPIVGNAKGICRNYPAKRTLTLDQKISTYNKKMPITRVMAKQFSLLFVNKGSLDMTMDLPMTGYVPGQQIPIKCLVKNKSRVSVSSIAFYLERIVTYVCKQPHNSARTEKHKIVKFIGHQIEKDSESLLEVALNVPALPPSSVKEALITMQYFVKVRVIVTGIHINPETQIPVKIGTIPICIQNQADTSTSTASRQPQIYISSAVNYPSCPDLSPHPSPDPPAFLRPSFPPFRSPQLVPLRNSHLPPFRSLHDFPPPTPPPQYSDLERIEDMGLPTYEESQMSSKMIEDDSDDEDNGVVYSPRYPVFQFSTKKSNP